MNRIVLTLAATFPLLCGGCESGDLAPPAQVNPAVHRAAAPNPTQHIPQRPTRDADGWPIQP
ncbi:MAG: hypothetical protein H0V56_13450 [Chthoniobacterales bacterium]|nr:hypothetical protein [Chthoniobacterales bacterium]